MIKIQCDLCGSEEKLYITEIEGTRLNVCGNCAKYGKIIAPLKEEMQEKPAAKLQKAEAKEPEREIVYMIIPDFAKKIRKRREQTGMTQKDFAKKLAERESVIHKLETGELTPSIKLAAKLEKLLNIKLIEEYEEKHEIKAGEGAGGLTIGDMLKIKKS